MKLTQNQYFGLESEIPSGLKEGSVFFAIDRLAVYLYDGGTSPTKVISNYITLDIEKAVRMTLTPYKLVTYLPINTPYTSPTLTADVPTRILIPTTVKSLNKFGIVNIGGGVLAYQFQGDYPAVFSLSLNTGILSSTNNTILTIELYKNSIVEPGVSSIRKISNADVGNMSITGEIQLFPLDTISIYATSSLSSSITFSRTSIQVVERN